MAAPPSPNAVPAYIGVVKSTFYPSGSSDCGLGDLLWQWSSQHSAHDAVKPGIGSHYQLTSALAASSLSAFSFSAFSFSRCSFSKYSFSAFSLAAASAAACSVEVPANRHEDAIETTHWHAACEQHAYPAAWASGLAQETAGRR